MKSKKGTREYMSVFGQYVITSEVFDQLRMDIESSSDPQKEIELTSALDKVRKKSGMIGVRLQGKMYDMGNYNAYVKCVSDYSK